MQKKGILIRSLFILAMCIATVMVTQAIYAIDPPHDAAMVPGGCNDCHIAHAAPGPSLTQEATNVILCQSCHRAGGTAAAKPMLTGEASPSAGTGKHHDWDAAMPLTSLSTNAYGLRAAADLTTASMRILIESNGNKLSCSVCHNQHSQARKPWDAASPLTSGSGGRHFLRSDNELNQLCEDCHYYRAMNYVRAKGEDPLYPANGTNKFSHPVGITLDASGMGYDRAVQLDGNGLVQTGSPRYAGDADGNVYNNLLLDNAGKVRCLSCHQMHYSDSNTETPDIP